jgi:protein TonB
VDDSQPTEVDPQLMNDQLTAAPKIPQDIKNKVKVEEPPSPGFVTPNTVDVAEAGTIGGAFSDQSRPKVTYVPYPVVSVPAAVAQGLLVQRTQPVYPPDAWYSGLTGKVVLEITVSRTGWVESVHLVSGARMFQKSAMDAVRTWRFKPYMIDNVAREFRTTLEVTFDQHSEGHPLSFLHFGSHSKKTSASAQSPQSDAAGAQ